MDNHFLPKALPRFGSGSVAYWSLAGADDLVVFVHGFCGEAVGTWLDFPRRMLGLEECKRWDVVFYGYDSRRLRVDFAAPPLHGFLDLMGTNPREVVNATLPQSRRRDYFEYQRIIIVAHSLGAIVTRRALLNARHFGANWLGRAELILFAPAHTGADVIKLSVRALSPLNFLGACFEICSRLRFPAIDDLEHGSQTLLDLEEETRRAITEDGAPYLVARRVFTGTADKIVSPRAFCDDPPMIPVPGRGHSDVCKPREDYRLPVEGVLK